jgi:hypothetical protein
MGKANHLGDYLRADHIRRGGIVPGTRRPVAGLRRDELALFASLRTEMTRLDVSLAGPQIVRTTARTDLYQRGEWCGAAR